MNERVAIVNRMQTDLRAVCPELLALTPKVDNVWFLNFITCREQLPKLIGLRKATLLALPQIGEVYASRIQVWQRSARFAPEVEWMGGMIIEDARRILALCADIKALDRAIGAITQDSELAKRIGTIRRIRQDLAGGAGG